MVLYIFLHFLLHSNKYKEPQISEGFADIVKVHCVPQFKKKTDEQLYRMYLVEK